MKTCVTILLLFALLLFFDIKSVAQDPRQDLAVAYFGDTLLISGSPKPQLLLQRPVDQTAIKDFYDALVRAELGAVVEAIKKYKNQHQLDDWLFYQLVRKTAQQLSPKAVDYERYTLYKWFLLVKCGYNAQLAMVNDKLLFYIQSDENIYDIPLFEREGKQFVCLNIHDFVKVDFNTDQLVRVDITVPGAVNSFSYKVKQIPDLRRSDYNDRELVFNYQDIEYRYNVKLNPQMAMMFNNYPQVDFASYFNIPLSKETYSSLIPVLKKKLNGMGQARGVDYLMNFTRHAFMYENDEQQFGKEKRLSPEQTLMNDYSDCDDRVALFYYLVKEIYDLPMIVLVYPKHITLAVELKKPVGTPVVYNGKKYSVCEPTPQRLELPMGKLMPELKDVAFQIAYEYHPQKQ